MVYQALYRKWRPRTFSAVVGQEAITDTLRNAIIRGKVSHAFVFSGPRGTGKTSCAKIFAKALNCLDLQDGEPCNKCVNCIAADNGSMPDIIEIDAASNNGVDEIREIRDKVKYAPTQGKYKVYIIDEVHMLSMGAFNALLKTLEEPPEHVVFILATTEIQKVPATIISRTQRYNFKRISKQDLVKRMKYILDQEHISYEDKALEVIAQVADGGMRDALSILDQLLSYEKDSVTYDDALKITGFAARKGVEELLLALLHHDPVTSMSLAQKMLDNGASSKNILDELIELVTNSLLYLKSANDNVFLLKDYPDKIKDVPEKHFFQVIADANDALNNLKYTNQQQIPLNVFLVKAATDSQNAASDQTNNNAEMQAEIANLQKQIMTLNQKLQNFKPTAIKENKDKVFRIDQTAKVENKPKIDKPVEAKPAEAKPKPKTKINKDKIFNILTKATRQDLQNAKDVWPDLKSVLAVSQRAILDVLEPVAASPETIIISCQYLLWFEKTNADTAFMTTLEQEIDKFTQHEYQIELISQDDWIKLRQEYVKQHRADMQAKKQEAVIQEDKPDEKHEEVIDKAKTLFGDAVRIKD